ncbi:hypothetical protein DVW87_08785 [Sphingomonas aracearum]|uniref:Uncharacterized protein n=1 Tax=Sphingomonas aracearum TaxID=2283317 RepID=A0A369VU16_9SPHN|nr:hypothetical protein DVW87_08785 [Sphingomonas aracearum]
MPSLRGLPADHRTTGEGVRFLRAGTLDRAERLVPRVHYFVRSEHPWIVLPEGVPALHTLPNRSGEETTG